MDLNFKTLIGIFKNQVRVTLKDGNQIIGLITSQTHDELDKEKIIRISVLESKPFGIPVSILTQDIVKLEVLGEPTSYSNLEEI